MRSVLCDGGVTHRLLIDAQDQVTAADHDLLGEHALVGLGGVLPRCVIVAAAASALDAELSVTSRIELADVVDGDEARAAQWIKAGERSAVRIGRWRSVGVDEPADALAWQRAGVEPEQMTDWRMQGVASGRDAIGWAQAGVALADIRSWLRAGAVDGADAGDWIAAGVERGQIMNWLATGARSGMIVLHARLTDGIDTPDDLSRFLWR